ncbi:KR domain-containing protein [Aspergillus oleicola]
MQSGKNTGKIVIHFRKDHQIPTLLCGIPMCMLESNVSFLLSGGMGGIGRRIARWMVSRGARYLILLSRTTKTDESCIQFLEELKLKGVTVAAPACNICDYGALKTVLDGLRTIMPPVKGCVQAAMELKNARFDAMSKSDFEAALRPKVMGSWNLHTLLPRDLDFFILCASISGVIPSFGQTNYAAGNTFQDALARYRVQRGEKAVSIDMGMFVDAGFVATHAGLADQLQARGSVPLYMEDLLRLLE